MEPTFQRIAAGWEAALIKRSGSDILAVGPRPQIVGNDLDDFADHLIARHKARA
ncbi:MAG: hypothetical protein WA679_12590 [Pseudolabrys sp.]|jgi:2-haloacid dehalogenase